MTVFDRARIAPNWTSAAGALEGILASLGFPLPRHAIMGLTGHAWHLCLGMHEGLVALPHGASDLDPDRLLASYARTGFRWQRFALTLPSDRPWDEARAAAVDWAVRHLDAGRPLIGWDFHLHEYGVVYGWDPAQQAFLVDDLLSADLGPLVQAQEWPSAATARIELLAPVEQAEADPYDAVRLSLHDALEAFAGRDGPPDGQPRGTSALDAWADAMEGDARVDRAGNAYTLAVLQAARTDGALFLEDLAASIPAASAALTAAARACQDEAAALSRLLTLFPFPAGGHGTLANPGLRRLAAAAFRRAAGHERDVAHGIESALAAIDQSTNGS